MEIARLKRGLLTGTIIVVLLLPLLPASLATSGNAIEITKPVLGHWYFFDNEISAIDPSIIVIWGDITIETDTSNGPDIYYVEFWVDDSLKGTIYNQANPSCNVNPDRGDHTLKVIGYDINEDPVAMDSVAVTKAVVHEFAVEQTSQTITIEQMLQDGAIDEFETYIIQSNINYNSN